MGGEPVSAHTAEVCGPFEILPAYAKLAIMPCARSEAWNDRYPVFPILWESPLGETDEAGDGGSCPRCEAADGLVDESPALAPTPAPTG